MHLTWIGLLALCAASASFGVYMSEIKDSETAAPLFLPAAQIGESGNVQLKLGEKAALDHLGPTIVNTDGSIKRIANWELLSEGERAAAWRRITQRNQERLATLKQQFEELQQQEDKPESDPSATTPGIDVQQGVSPNTPAAAQPAEHDEL